MEETDNFPIEKPRKGKTYTDRTLFMLGMVIVAGLLGVLAYPLHFGDRSKYISVVCTALMLAGACLLIGGLLGFLFGVPRTMQQDQTGLVPPPEDDVTSGRQTFLPTYLANTNLEQISDWLTKILVGVGLTQLTKLPQELQRIGNYLAEGLGNASSSRAFGITALLYFLVSGFLLSYVWTRLFFPVMLRVSDINVYNARIGRLRREITELKKESKDIIDEG